jgi:hypothetical protein
MHPLSSDRKKIPEHLWIEGMFFYDDNEVYDGNNEFPLDGEDLPTDKEFRLEVPDVEVTFSEENMLELQSEVNPLDANSNYGIDIFQKDLDLIVKQD